MSKFSSFAVITIIALSLTSCKDKTKALEKTWRVENVVFSKQQPPQVMAIIQNQIDEMKSNDYITYKADGSYEEVEFGRTHKGTWDYAEKTNSVYSTGEMGTARFIVKELNDQKFTYSVLRGSGDTLTFYYVPFAAKDTLNRKPRQQMMQPRQQDPQEDQQAPTADSAASK